MEAVVYNSRIWVSSTDENYLKDTINNALKEVEYDVRNYSDTHFDPYGWTGTWVLAESHLAIHTFPESHASYIELTSDNMDKQKAFVQILKKMTKPIKVMPTETIFAYKE